MNKLPLGVLALILGTVVPAAAQTTTEATIFVIGGGSFDWSSLGTAATGETTVAHQTTAGGSIGIGTRLRGPVSLRFEFGQQGTVTTTTSLVLTSAQLGISLPVPFPAISSTTTRIAEVRSRTGNVLLGYRLLEGGRVGVEFLGGVTIVAQRQHSVTTTTTTFLTSDTVVEEALGTIYRNAPAFGVDFNVQLSPRAALVPQVRTYVLSGSLTVQIGAAFRMGL